MDIAVEVPIIENGYARPPEGVDLGMVPSLMFPGGLTHSFGEQVRTRSLNYRPQGDNVERGNSVALQERTANQLLTGTINCV